MCVCVCVCLCVCVCVCVCMSLGGAGGHFIYHLQTLEVNLTQNMSTAVWVPPDQVVASLLLPWFKVTPLVGQAANEIHCMFVPEEGWNSGYIHILLDELR